MKAESYSDKLNRLIPGGAHTYSRGDDQYPSNAPQILKKGYGAYVYDVYGNMFLDYGMGLRSVSVGYANEEINAASINEINNGNCLTRPSLVELNAAELITDIIDSAEMVKFAKNGSTVTSAAVKLARAYTGKKYIVRCADHPFYSYDDWFIGNTPITKGIPDETIKLTLNFKYNDLRSLERLFDSFGSEIACVIMELMTINEPLDGFLQAVIDLCHKNGAIFIADEMITGFRWHLKGAQKKFKVIPDLSTFGKGMANGFSVAALTGKKEIMNLGGIKNKGKERVFLVSTTHGAEMCGLGAFIKTMDLYKKYDVVDHIWRYGEKLLTGINKISKSLGLLDYFYLEGYPCSPGYVTKNREGESSLEFRTLFAQEMLKSGVLIPWIALSYSHKDLELQKTLEACEKSLNVYAKALENGIGKYLKGNIIKPVFRKFN